MKNIYETRFAKIGTNPMKYFENYQKYINELNIGDHLVLKDFCVFYNDVPKAEFYSEATFRQNIDAWVWMGFCIRKDKCNLIKIIPKLDEKSLLEVSKMALLAESTEELVNIHRNTILIKLLSLLNNKSYHQTTSLEEIRKESGRYEEILISDCKYMQLITLIWDEKR